MSRKLLVISIAWFFILAFTNLSWGWIGGKYFDMSETIKIKMTVKKAGSASDTGTGYDTFYFGGGGSFYMDNMDMSGAWSQVKKKFTVTIPYGDIEYYMHSVLDLALDEALSYECWDYEGDFSGITLTKYSFNGTESKDGGSIKGKISFTLGFSAYLYCDGKSLNTTGKATFTNSFTGWDSTLSPPADVLVSTDSDSFPEILGKAVRNAISGSSAIPVR